MRHTKIFWLMLSLMLALAYLAQSFLWLHGDVGYLAYVSGLLLDGGKYGSDFFETNPPMILYLYAIPYRLSHFLSISITSGMQIVIFLLIIYASVASSILLRRIIKNQLILNLFLGLMVAVLCFLPANQFAQREHIFLILMLPYLFSTACWLENKKNHLLFSLLIGLMAGIGFAIKPYFIAPLITIEFLVMLHTKRWFGWCRVESLTVLFVLVTYLLSIVIWHSAYFTIILPLLKQFYFSAVSEPWISLLSNALVLFCFSAVMVYPLIRKHVSFPVLYLVLVLALIGSIFSFLVTRTSWFYHTIPALGLACLFYGLFLVEIISNTKIASVMAAVIAGAAIFFIPVKNSLILFQYYASEKSSSPYTRLTSYLSKAEGEHSLMCFSANTTGDCFPLLFDTHSRYSSRYPFFWWFRGMLKGDKSDPNAQFLVRVLAEDLDQLKPRWIVINLASSQLMFGEDFNYLNYFNDFPSFVAAFKPYHYSTTIDNYQIYERDSSKPALAAPSVKFTGIAIR